MKGGIILLLSTFPIALPLLLFSRCIVIGLANVPIPPEIANVPIPPEIFGLGDKKIR